MSVLHSRVSFQFRSDISVSSMQFLKDHYYRGSLRRTNNPHVEFGDGFYGDTVRWIDGQHMRSTEPPLLTTDSHQLLHKTSQSNTVLGNLLQTRCLARSASSQRLAHAR